MKNCVSKLSRTHFTSLYLKLSYGIKRQRTFKNLFITLHYVGFCFVLSEETGILKTVKCSLVRVNDPSTTPDNFNKEQRK